MQFIPELRDARGGDSHIASNFERSEACSEKRDDCNLLFGQGVNPIRPSDAKNSELSRGHAISRGQPVKVSG
jgi:hypothetical protein